MNASEDHAHALLEQTDYNKREALLLLRKRTIARCGEEGVAVGETIDRAFEVAIAIAVLHVRHTQESILEENKRIFWERFGEFKPIHD
jgi:hypothetical protein